MAMSSITSKVHQPLDVHRYFTTQVAFHFKLRRFRPKFFSLLFTQILHLDIACNTSVVAYLLRSGTADSKYGGQANLNMLVVRQVNSSYSCHVLVSK